VVRLIQAVFAALLVLTVVGGYAAPTTQAAIGNRIMLRVLVVSGGDPGTGALATQMDREGVPYQRVDLRDAARPTITAEYLADASTGTGHFQAIILPNAAGGGLSADEMAAIAADEEAFGVRQVNAYEFPGGHLGFTNPAFSGTLDGGTAQVTTAGGSVGFGYLAGSLRLDDFDPGVAEIYGYLGVPADPMPSGQSITPLVTATQNGATGALLAVHTESGREQLVISAAFNEYMQAFDALAPGIISWATRGIHLGYQRNYLNVHIDDVFLPDSRWSVTDNCTPGDDCLDPNVTTTDIRMTGADATRLLNWQATNNFRFDMVFNAGGSIAVESQLGRDPLTDNLLNKEEQFRWINHTWSHPYLGCIQIAPTIVGQTWQCATSESDAPRIDADVTGEMSGGTYWASQSLISDQVATNNTWALNNKLTNYSARELVTGEHSGLRSLPQMTTDNPFLAPALAGLGITHVASDASREPAPRTLDASAISTLPRHPMNVYYNTGTFTEAVDEYNWYYTTQADGGSGICENNPSSTCISPLDASTPEAAWDSFTGYIQVLEVRNAIRYLLTNDPRPIYAHQSNLAEDGVLYPVVEDVLSQYASIYDRSKAPIVQAGMSALTAALERNTDFRATSASVDAYVDSAGVHVPDASVDVPLTVPAGSVGTGLNAYAGELSGWLPTASTVRLPTPAGGYVLNIPPTVPGAPTIGTVTPGSTTVTVTWTPPLDDGHAPITGYVIRAYKGSTPSLVSTTVAPAEVTSWRVTGLTNGTAYRFRVAATNDVGTGAESALSAWATPRAALGGFATNVVGEPGNKSARVTWELPSVTDGITTYRVRAIEGTSVRRTVNVAAPLTSAALSDLKNGVVYTFDVTAIWGSTVGKPSVASAPASPDLFNQSQTAPAITSVVPGNASIAVGWAPPADGSAGAVKEYKIRAFEGAFGTSAARSVTVGPTQTSVILPSLKNGVAYSVEVEVVYPSGAVGGFSARSTAVIPRVVVG
jgi:hypothetical protein